MGCNQSENGKDIPNNMMKYLKIIYKYWMKFAYALGWINSRIILTVLYVFLVGAYAFVSSVMEVLRDSGVFRSKSQRVGWLVKKYEKPTEEILRRQF